VHCCVSSEDVFSCMCMNVICHVNMCGNGNWESRRPSSVVVVEEEDEEDWKRVFSL
jgi:hypothetical protein